MFTVFMLLHLYSALGVMTNGVVSFFQKHFVLFYDLILKLLNEPQRVEKSVESYIFLYNAFSTCRDCLKCNINFIFRVMAF